MSEPSNTSSTAGVQQSSGETGVTRAVNGAGAASEPPAVSADTTPELQFKSSEVESKSVRQEDPFREHKVRAAQKKQKDKKIRKRVLMILGVVVALVLVGLGVWWLVATITTEQEQTEPEATSFLNDESIKNIQSTATEIYNSETDDSSEQNVESVTEYYEEQKNEAANTEDRNRIIIAQMLFYAANARPDLVIELGGGINLGDLPVDEGLTYCGTMVNAWSSLGELDKAAECEQYINDNGVVSTNGQG